MKPSEKCLSSPHPVCLLTPRPLSVCILSPEQFSGLASTISSAEDSKLVLDQKRNVNSDEICAVAVLTVQMQIRGNSANLHLCLKIKCHDLAAQLYPSIPSERNHNLTRSLVNVHVLLLPVLLLNAFGLKEFNLACGTVFFFLFFFFVLLLDHNLWE